MCIAFVCMRYVKKFGCHYNQSGVLKIEILILLRLARFQNLGTPLIVVTRCDDAGIIIILFYFYFLFYYFLDRGPKVSLTSLEIVSKLPYIQFGLRAE